MHVQFDQLYTAAEVSPIYVKIWENPRGAPIKIALQSGHMRTLLRNLNIQILF